MNMSGKCTPFWGVGTPHGIKNFPRHGKIKRLMGPRNHEIFFPDMFIEHVWEMTPTAIIAFFWTKNYRFDFPSN